MLRQTSSGECYPFFSCEAILDLVVVGEEERGFCLSLSPASLVLRLHPATPGKFLAAKDTAKMGEHRHTRYDAAQRAAGTAHNAHQVQSTALSAEQANM